MAPLLLQLQAQLSRGNMKHLMAVESLFPEGSILNTWDASSGLSMNILCACDKSPVQRVFFKNSAGDLLPALGFLGGLYNFVIL